MNTGIEATSNYCIPIIFYFAFKNPLYPLLFFSWSCLARSLTFWLRILIGFMIIEQLIRQTYFEDIQKNTTFLFLIK